MNFKFSDMRDLHLFTCLSGRKLFESSVSVFFREEQLLREYFESIRLKHNDDLWDILSEFIVASRANDVQEYILGNEKLCEGTKPLKDRIQKDIIAADVEDVRGSNNALLLPYVCLYDILKDEAESIKRYQQWMMDNNVKAT